ncbi:MAG: acetate uptake transporter [Alphaproteobacteria bacterium]|nr:acetate uptake transporter [Alphaproteobacteria bacterium]
MTDTKILDTTGNPAPLGLLAFGMTTVLLNFHNAGFYPLDSMILAMGIFYGGLAQVIAGIMEWRKGNTFATTAFTSYGMFWLTLVGLILLPKMDLGVAAPVKDTAMALYLTMWGIFTLMMFKATFSLNRALQVVFGSLALLFFLLAIGDATGNETIAHLAGWEGLLCGISAIYAGMAQVINETSGKTLWPIGPMKKKAH